MSVFSSDAEILMVLDQRAMGLSADAISRNLSRQLGRSIPSVAAVGLLASIDLELEDTDADGFGNGQLSAGWWRDGLAVRCGRAQP